MLFACLIGLFGLQPLLARHQVLDLDFALSLVLLASVWSVSRRKSLLAAGLAFVAPAMAAIWWARPEPETRSAVLLAGLGCALGLLALTAGVVLWRVLRARTVTTGTILGGLSVYLLLALVWALLYTILERLAPGSFALVNPATPAPESRAAAAGFVDYSVGILTTMGPVDVRPVAATARAWTGLEAITGQLYVAVLIARLVGLHASQSGSRD
jgi:hypothetical protein